MKNDDSNYLMLTIGVVGVVVFILKYLIKDSAINFYACVGLFLMIPSIVFYVIVRIQSGSSLSLFANPNKFSTEGVFKKIRHPVSFFGFIILLGIIFLIQNFYLIIIWFLLILLQHRKIKNEEKILEEKFGEQYLEYKKNTWF
jgi:protein-S-isoprenylcysteine O-methyltransferase Ste14